MPEQNTDTKTNEQERSTATEDQSTQEYTEIELKAMAQGWVPADEWQGDPEDHVDAREFIRRGELMDRIRSQTKQLRNQSSKIDKLEKALNELAEHNKKLAEIEFKKALDVLRKEKAEALVEEDTDRVAKIEEQIDELKESKAKIEQTKPVATDNRTPEEIAREEQRIYEEWVSKPENKWYTENDVMQAYADKVATDYYRDNPDVPFTEVIEYAVRKVKERFPKEFANKRRSAPSSVAETDDTTTTRKSRSSKSKFTARDLTEDQLQVAKTFEASGVMTIQEYVDQLAEIGELQ